VTEATQGDTASSNPESSTGIVGRIAQLTAIVAAVSGLLASLDALFNNAPVACKIVRELPWCKVSDQQNLDIQSLERLAKKKEP
jgi:hypothetical protein